MNKLALADRFEGYSKIFASDSNMGIDLKAMADTLREMPEEKFAKVINANFDIGIGKAAPMMHQRTPLSDRPHNIGGGPKAKMIPEQGLSDIAKKHQIPAEKMKSIYQDIMEEASEEVEASESVDANFDIGIGKAAPMMHQRTPQSERPYNVGGQPKAKMIPEKGLADIAKKHQIPAEKMKSIYQDIMEEASEEVEACMDKKEANIEAWTKSASDLVAQNLVRDILGMEKSICCDTKRHQTPKQMPDAKKKQETKGAVNREEDTGAALKPEQVPNLSVKLDSDMFKKSKGPVRKEAGAAVEETPDAKAAEPQEVKDAGKVKDPAKEIAKMQEDKKKEELKEKSRPEVKKEETSEVEANTLVAEGIEFDNVMQEVDANDEDVKKLSALFE
jgi:hypothetical protein